MMMPERKIRLTNVILSVLYFIIGGITIALQNSQSFYPGFISKALIVPVLIFLFLSNLNAFKNRDHSLLLAGLFFSWAGDVILDLAEKNENYFVFGLVCFLCTHVLYLSVFLLTPGKKSVSRGLAYSVIPVILYGINLISYLNKFLGTMKLPVIIYSIVILAMLSGAITRKDKVNVLSFYIVLSGAILFVISDSAIAIDKFRHHFGGSGAVIMSTYVMAQYLIVTGYVNGARQRVQISL